ncbi:hypothetical protein PO587_02775 [Streptomyces gilvifuscus]|uniref:DUF4760 domain-containing protein n=1 Tax=Streptomyces gilvifuscus TaxID=1550617 RepID=A0ABT5FLJ4_9ACTN|nr:hypothetical protein [Streptomyces gilvifuscus]MDC2953375.1 hypothetical protein [Streptomyces gilvifuscus]
MAQPVINVGSTWDTNWFAVAAISQAIVALFVLIGVVGLRQGRRLRIIAYEDRFEERYWSLMERLSLEALRAAVQAPDAPYPERGADLLVARSYFRLCETQLNVRASGWITDATWSLWEKGITDRMSRYPFKAAWQEVDADQGLYKRLRLFVDGGGDPCRLWLPVRWWRGLTGKSRR